MDQAKLSAVLERVSAGDADALAELYGEFHPRVLGLCRYLLGSREEAEDAASDVFARLRLAIRSYDSSLPFPRWVLSVTSHHCVDLLRRRRIEQRLFESTDADAPEPAEPAPSPLGELLSNEEKDTVRTAVASLPDRYRVPLVLRYYNEFSYDEIAATLNLTRPNVATLIFRAKKDLREALAKHKTRRRSGEKGKWDKRGTVGAGFALVLCESLGPCTAG